MCSIFALGLIFVRIQNNDANTGCDEALSQNSEFTGLCNSQWKDLQPLVRPGQAVVGYAWVKQKLENDFASEKETQKYLDSNPILGVINPGIGGSPLITVVDHHHTLCALDYSGFEHALVRVNIICDYRNLTWEEFYASMEKQNLIYLGRHPVGEPNKLSALDVSLPNSFQFTEHTKSLQNDPWRAISSFSRKVENPPDGFPSCGQDDDKFCERCYIRKCQNSTAANPNPPSIPFYEFQWGYFMNYAVFYNSSYWPTFEEWQDFTELYLKLDTNFETLDYNDWQSAANLLIPLCRNWVTGTYELPEEIFGNLESRYLPGFVGGSSKMPADPDCGSAKCKTMKSMN